MSFVLHDVSQCHSISREPRHKLKMLSKALQNCGIFANAVTMHNFNKDKAPVPIVMNSLQCEKSAHSDLLEQVTSEQVENHLVKSINAKEGKFRTVPTDLILYILKFLGLDTFIVMQTVSLLFLTLMNYLGMPTGTLTLKSNCEFMLLFSQFQLLKNIQCLDFVGVPDEVSSLSMDHSNTVMHLTQLSNNIDTMTITNPATFTKSSYLFSIDSFLSNIKTLVITNTIGKGTSILTELSTIALLLI